MPAAKSPRIVAVTRLGDLSRRTDGLREYAALEYRAEDPLWLRAQIRAPPRPLRSRFGWLTRLLGHWLPARNPGVEPDSAADAIAP